MRALVLLSIAATVTSAAARADQVVLKDGRKVEVARPLRVAGNVVDGPTRGQAFSVREDQVVSPPLWSLPIVMRLKNGQTFAASGLSWKDGKVRFQVASTAEKIQVVEDQVVFPPVPTIPRVLALKNGQEVPALQIARSEGKVRFQVASTGERVQVTEDQIASPPPASLPTLLRLANGQEVPALQVARADGKVRFQVAATGERLQVPEDEITSPPVSTLPMLLRLANGQEVPVTGLERKGDKVRFQVVATGEKIEVGQDQVLAPPLDRIALAEGPPAPGPTPPPPTPPVLKPTPVSVAKFEPLTDRWRILDTLMDRLPKDPRFVRGRTLDPYNQNTLKGDRPVIGQDVFLVLTGTLEAPFEARRLPLPSGVSAARPASLEFFGDGNQVFTSPVALVSAEVFKGDTAFKPKTWSIKATGAFDLNYLRLRENNSVNINPGAGQTRTKNKASLEEAFGELKLADLSPYYDVISLRAGIQPFVSDFRGFIFSDSNLGARLFGNACNNRIQYNAAYFDLLEKDTNSDLNTFHKRDQKVFIANLFRQDIVSPGFTFSLSYHRNQDEASKDFHYDQNGFLVRPAKIGSPRLHNLVANYVGLTSDGHLGRINVDEAVYYAFGHDDSNPLGDPERANTRQNISAEMAALELSLDRDWARFRISGFFASGDDDAEDGKAHGFDSIDDLTNFGGGPFSFWNRSGIPLTQTGVLLKTPGSLLPDLRSSKFEGQANFVNPGILLANAALDLEITPKLKAVLNANYLRFHKTGALSLLLFQPGIRKDIGIDLGAGFVFRPTLTENVVIKAGITGLIPRGAAEDLFSSPCSGAAAGCGAPSRKLYNAFAELKLTY